MRNELCGGGRITARPAAAVLRPAGHGDGFRRSGATVIGPEVTA
ncbi:hypothetical protein ABIE67_003437 [Streptomyces sp. V4I8]